jgi:uncharacterized protein (TIGR00725 family)
MVIPKNMYSFFGGSMATEKEFNISYKLGYLLAKKNWVLVNGAGPGCMLGVSMGAKDAGGLTIGIVPEGNIEKMNNYIDIPITTGIGYTRNFLNSNASLIGIAVGGYAGTLNEITNSWMIKKPVLMINNWKKEQLDYRSDRPTDILYDIEIKDTWEDCEKAVDVFEYIYKNRKRLGKDEEYSKE